MLLFCFVFIGMAALLLHRADWLNLTINNHFYPTWRIYLLVCGLPSVLGLFTACFLPRSPKCLIAQGKNHEALKQFRRMYSWNHFKTSDDYSVNIIIFGMLNVLSNKLFSIIIWHDILGKRADYKNESEDANKSYVWR